MKVGKNSKKDQRMGCSSKRAILLLAIAVGFPIAGCSTNSFHTDDTHTAKLTLPQEAYQFKTFFDNSKTSRIIDLRQRKVKWFFSIDALDEFFIEVCEPESDFFCAQFEKNEPTIAIPKIIDGINWEYDEIKYTVTNEVQTSKCATDRMIIAEKDGEPYRALIYNSVEGLKMFAVLEKQYFRGEGGRQFSNLNWQIIWFISPQGMWSSGKCE